MMISSKDSSGTVQYRKWKKSSMERHDLYNFESKIDYTIDRYPKDKSSSYLLETYFFIPETLQVNKESYTKEQFFLDLNNRIRFKTPQMSIKGILDKKNELSPVNIILDRLKEIEYGRKEKAIKTRIEREIRLLACIIKVSLRDQFNYILTNRQTLTKQYDISELLGKYLNSINKLQDKLKCLRDKFLMAQIPFDLREAFQFADEYISLQIEEWVTQALKAVRKECSSEILSQIKEIIECEQENRKAVNSRLIISQDSDNEAFTYGESILKKYVQGVLYLEKEKKDPKSTSLEIFYFVAAGFAMFLSLFLGFLLLSSFTANSIAFIIGAVVIYMLKDRIKDTMQRFSNKAVGLVFPDKKVDILDEFYQKKIGVSKEKANFIGWSKVPPEILKIRRSSNRSPLEEKGKPENVLNYMQEITLFNEKIAEIHVRKKDLSNIIRFNIRQLLRYADDPVEFIPYWNANKNKLEKSALSKVYHLNVILKLTSFREKKVKSVYFKKFRVILDQRGIKRIEEPDFSL